MARGWSRRARRDFDERKEYRESRGEEDRYRKEEPDKKEEEEKEDILAERGYEYMDMDEYVSSLMQIRNAALDDDVDDLLERLRREKTYYEAELNDYDEEYDRAAREINRLKNENARQLLRQTATAKKQQDEDIKEDGDYPKSYDELFYGREG